MTSVASVHIADKEEFKEKRIAGSFYCSEPDSDGDQYFWYCCPCGCKNISPLLVGNGFKPETGNRTGRGFSWNWNGSFEKATLTPSVHWKGHYHGWLKDGIWTSC